MATHKHIINKQIIEIELPKQADAFGIQQTLGKLYNEKFTPIIDKLLCDRYGRDEKKRYQIDQLIVDLGNVKMEDIADIFTEKFNDALISIEDSRHEEPIEKKPELPEKTPLQVVSYYLKTGRLPWWSSKTSKTYLLEQLDQLIKTPDATFTKLLSQLPYNHSYLDRFLYTFTENQILLCLQILTDISIKGIPVVQKELVDNMVKRASHKASAYTAEKIAKTFWKVAFNQVPKAIDYKNLIASCKEQLRQELGVDAVKKEKGSMHLPTIRSLVENHKKQYPNDTIWQHFFEHLIGVVHHPSFYQIPDHILKELKNLLEALRLEHHKSETVTETKLQPIVRQLQVLEAMLKPLQPDSKPNVIEQLQSNFEETEFISVQNAGLVLLWPFLQRFFENLEVIENKAFCNEIARNKAVCALQYLCDTSETEFFEGMLPLTKVLCGISLEDTIPLISLSVAEKEMAESLLHAVIERGPHWKNLSLDGFRTSYLCRQGSLRTRDGHWLLQVQKETYDITLEKLPWSINTIKLPWMNKIILVEWN
ncbi:contractile injection system tape measure protein [Ascidiimonas sp. W6]|uniref:contractile injection system tape measure protein n=1 Tax=Ascidiimonas meishanensis TaxID=3128903 RepID=UPI0030EE9712